jgi:hypothetical protein
MRGMEEIIRRWPSLRCGEKLYFGGFGSEPLKKLAVGNDVVFKGAMTDEELAEMQAGIRGAVVYQSDGSGALTRISEFLLADVPVVVNSHAARSYYNLPGIVEFRYVDDLGEAVKKATASDIECEPPLSPDTSVLVARLRRLCGEEGAARAAQIKSLAHDRLSAEWLGSTERERSALLEKIQKYDELRLELAALASERDSLRSAREALAATNYTLLAERDGVVVERDALAAERNALVSSRDAMFKSLSWRLTAPLRRIGKVFIRTSK